MNGKSLTLYADGGSRGNPGPAGAGAYLVDENGSELAKLHQYLGETTNNVAEYQGLIIGLEAAVKHQAQTLTVLLDSQLIVRQLNGQYRVKQPHLKPLFAQAKELLRQIPQVEIKHIPREENTEADQLANLAMDEGT